MQLKKYGFFFLMALMVCSPSASAGPAEAVDSGAIFGGQSTNATLASSSILNLSELPAMVEVYTATWCSNCVEVEHALDDVESNVSMQQYHVHRSISEVQDPFGTDVLDQRFHDRYGRWSPPAVVFNGTTMVKGSVSESGSLVQDFTTIALQQAMLGNGTSSFTWTPTGDSLGTVAWAVDIDVTQFGEGTLGAYLWVVEGSAYFEEGTNGLENYPHIVRDIIHLGDVTEGVKEVTLPAAFDGNDLSVHLVYQFSPGEETITSESTESMPFMTSLGTLSMIGAAVAVRRT